MITAFKTDFVNESYLFTSKTLDLSVLLPLNVTLQVTLVKFVLL